MIPVIKLIINLLFNSVGGCLMKVSLLFVIPFDIKKANGK